MSDKIFLSSLLYDYLFDRHTGNERCTISLFHQPKGFFKSISTFVILTANINVNLKYKH
jgi:hypothetical protein